MQKARQPIDVSTLSDTSAALLYQMALTQLREGHYDLALHDFFLGENLPPTPASEIEPVPSEMLVVPPTLPASFLLAGPS